MIHFQCPGCSAGLRVAEDKAGKLTRCPSCKRTVRAPGRVQEVEELPVVEDEEEEEVEAAEDEEEARPRRRRRRREDDEDDDGPWKGRRLEARPPPAETYEDEERRREIITRNRVMGVVGFVLGLTFAVSALISGLTGVVDLRNPLTTPYNAGGCFGLLLGLLMIVVGLVYAIRG